MPESTLEDEWYNPDRAINLVLDVVTRLTFYEQIGAVVLTLLGAWVLSRGINRKLDSVGLPDADDDSPHRLRDRVYSVTYQVRDLLFPALSALLLGVTVALSGEFFDQTWLVRFVQSINFLSLIYMIVTRTNPKEYVRHFMVFVIVPIIILYGLGLLDNITRSLSGIVFEFGTITFTLYGAIRTVVFGVILFWLGRISNATGQEIIRNRVKLDDTNREIALKSFQIALFVAIALVFLQVAGIDLTALVVFGGAIGVGLGFGLQQIASNFISGIIILLDRSITIGDFIELEDGRSGRLRELSMRSATLETYDGKDIMVPNERFITTAFTNWTHNNDKQRYPIVFEVAYGTDLEKLFNILREVVGSHPQVLSGEEYPIEERPDAEVQAFNDSGIEILVEFWMRGIDDGKNRVGGDLLLMLWAALREHNIEIPFPQTEVRLLEPKIKK
jgi:small-conductance mechanosensitive channel